MHDQGLPAIRSTKQSNLRCIAGRKDRLNKTFQQSATQHEKMLAYSIPDPPNAITRL